MPESLDIEMPVSGAEDFKTALLEGADAAERAAKAHERTLKAIQEASKAARSAGGPFARNDAAQRALALAKSGAVGGNTLADIQYRAEQSQKAVDRLKPKGFADRMGDFLGSSRFSMFGGKLMPQVSQAANLIGGSGGASKLGGMLKNPWMIAATLVIEGGRHVYQAMERVASEAATVGRQFAALRTEAGSDATGASGLRAFGISGSQARSLSERIATDPVAMMYGHRLGAHATPGPFGTLDTAPNALKIVEGLRRLPEQERLRAMRILGVENLAPMTRVSGDTMNRLRGDAQVGSRIMDSDFEKRVAEFDVSKDRFEKSLENLKAAVGKHVMPGFTWLTNTGADAFNNLARLFGGGSESETAGKINGHLDRQASALEANTDATLRLTKAIGMTQRAQDAVPGFVSGPGGRGDGLARAAESGALRLGVL